MTHADVRGRLRAYADGTLADVEAEIVRAHLASGCEECLRDVFTRPPGMARPPIGVRRSSRGAAIGIAAAAAIVALGIGLAPRLWNPRPGVDDEAVRQLRDEMARLRAERDAAERGSRDALARLEARVDEAEKRATDGTRSGVTPPPSTAPEPDPVPPWLDDLLATDGTRVIPLQAAGFASGATGWAVSNLGRGMVVVVASGLPTGDDTTGYRARVLLGDLTTVWASGLTVSASGRLTATIMLPDRRWRVVKIELYRDPPGEPALAARIPR